MTDLRLWPAVAEDLDLTFAWANDPVTRTASFDSRPIDRATHEQWFGQSLAGARQLFIGTLAGAPVGLVRFDTVGPERAEISVTVAPERRGRGIGRMLLAAGLGQARVLRFSSLTARVRGDNVASRRLFEGAGFILDDGVAGTGAAVLTFGRELADD